METETRPGGGLQATVALKKKGDLAAGATGCYHLAWEAEESMARGRAAAHTPSIAHHVLGPDKARMRVRLLGTYLSV